MSASTAGIRAAIAEGLAREGARVIVNGRSQERVDKAVDAIRARHPQAELDTFAGDLSTPEAVHDLTDRFPRVDILVNNLGIFEPKPFPACGWAAPPLWVAELYAAMTRLPVRPQVGLSKGHGDKPEPGVPDRKRNPFVQ